MIQTIQEITQPFLNKKCWHIGRSYGSMLILDFGKKVEDISPEWGLTIETANWFLKNNDEEVVNGESDKKDIDSNIQILKDRSIEKIEIINNQTIFFFDEKISLEVNQDIEREQWMLFTPDKMVLSMGPSDKWTFEPSDKTVN